MKKARRWRLVLILIAIASLIAQAAMSQSKPVNIKQAIDIALANNYGLQSDSLNINISDYKNKELTGAYLPQVNYKNAMEYNPSIPNQMLPGSVIGQPSKDLVAVQFGTKYKISSGVEVNQNIYRKDLLIQMRAEGLNYSIAQTRYHLSKEQLVYTVASSFYNLQTSAEMIRATASDYLDMKNILAIAKAQFENGTLKKIDYETLEINVASSESQLNLLRTSYNQQLDYFKYLLAIPASAQLSIEDSIMQVSTMLLSDDILKREDLHLSQQKIELKEAELNSIRAEKLPAVSSYVRYNYQSQFNSAGKAFDNGYWTKGATIGISASISIFDGNRRKSRISAAQAELQQLKLQDQQQKDKARAELATAWSTLNNNLAQYQITQKNLALAEKVFTSRKALYTEGVTTLIELLDAEKDLTQARNLYMQALIDVQTGSLDVYKASGTLLTGFLKSI